MCVHRLFQKGEEGTGEVPQKAGGWQDLGQSPNASLKKFARDGAERVGGPACTTSPSLAHVTQRSAVHRRPAAQSSVAAQQSRGGAVWREAEGDTALKSRGGSQGSAEPGLRSPGLPHLPKPAARRRATLPAGTRSRRAGPPALSSALHLHHSARLQPRLRASQKASSGLGLHTPAQTSPSTRGPKERAGREWVLLGWFLNVC